MSPLVGEFIDTRQQRSSAKTPGVVICGHKLTFTRRRLTTQHLFGGHATADEPKTTAAALLFQHFQYS